MRHEDVPRLTALLGSMRQFELALEAFYEACAAAFPTDAGFWRGIAAEERRHAEMLDQLAALVAEDPTRFSWGRPFQPAALATATAGVLSAAARVRGGEIATRNALVLARDYERSVLENRYGEVLRSSDPACTALLDEIVVQTQQHQANVEQRLRESGGAS